MTNPERFADETRNACHPPADVPAEMHPQRRLGAAEPVAFARTHEATGSAPRQGTLMATCIKCKQDKPESEFYRRTDGKLRGTCKPCWRVQSRAYQKEHPEQYREYWRTVRSKQERWVRTIWERWRLTPADFDRMMAEQGGVCRICKLPPRHKSSRSDEIARFHIDHDHETGQLRGLLCGTCNKMLGQAQDDPAILRAGAEYLENSRRMKVVG